MASLTATDQASKEATFVSAAEACRQSGLSRPRLQTLAVAGEIRVRARVGNLPRYCLEDAIHLGREAK